MKNILVISDKADSDTLSLEKGMLFAAHTGAHLEIVAFCFENLAGISSHAMKSETEVQKDILGYMKRSLKANVEKVRSTNKNYADIKLTMEVVWEKNTHTWLEQRTKAKLYDFVIKTGHHSEGVFYSITDWRLIRTSHAPVYLLSDKSWKKKGRVLAALDVDNKSQAKNKLNHKILQASKTLADAMQLDLHCCFVIEIPTILRELDVVDKSTYVKKAREEYFPKVAEMVKAYGIPESNIHRKVGGPVGNILNIANELKVNCLVIGSIGRKGISGKLIGNTAEQVIRHLYADMLVVNLD